MTLLLIYIHTLHISNCIFLIPLDLLILFLEELNGDGICVKRYDGRSQCKSTISIWIEVLDILLEGRLVGLSSYLEIVKIL